MNFLCKRVHTLLTPPFLNINLHFKVRGNCCILNNIDISYSVVLRRRMGVIKDGYISGVLPTSKVFAVNYPGYPLSMEHAVTTLG